LRGNGAALKRLLRRNGESFSRVKKGGLVQRNLERYSAIYGSGFRPSHFEERGERERRMTMSGPEGTDQGKNSDAHRKGTQKSDALDQLFKARQSILERSEDKSSKKGVNDSSSDAALKAGKKVGESAAAPEQPKLQTFVEGMRGQIDDFFIDRITDLADNLFFDAFGLGKTAVDYLKIIAESVDEAHRGNIQAATRKGIAQSYSIILQHLRSPDNPHIKTGKPYSGRELHKEVQEVFLKGGGGQELTRDKAFGSVEAAKPPSDAPTALRDAVHMVAGYANDLLRKGKNPDERAALMQVFLSSLEQNLKESYGQSGRIADDLRRRSGL
jgi:hypothetical protein